MVKLSSPYLIVPALVTGVLFSSAAWAGDVTLHSRFKLSFLGLGVGKMKTTTWTDGANYKISGSAKSGRVVSVVSSTKASFASNGRISGRTIIPNKQNLNYKSNKKRGSQQLAFAAGNVVKAVVTPHKKPKKGTIPVQSEHLLSVLDPVSSVLFPVLPNEIGDGQKICNRILPIYSGRQRLNLQLSYVSSRKRKAKGFEGLTFKCSVRYQPIAGYRPFKKNVKYMIENRNIHLTVARVGNTNIYSLFAFRVQTKAGVASGYATKFATN